MNQQLMFVHVPKTAGTTVRHFIESHFSDDTVFPSMLAVDQDPFLYRDITRVKSCPEAAYRRALLVRSHVPYPDLIAVLDAKPLTLCMLRNPLRRAISEILHHQRGNAQLRSLPLETMIIEQPNAYLPSWHYLGRSMEEAIHNVCEFDWLGIQECFEVSMDMLCEKLDWAKPVAWELENAMPADQQARPVSLRAIDLLSEKLRDDMSFYLAARSEFERRTCVRRIRSSNTIRI